MKKKFPSLHLNADDFIPATNDEKESLVVMRDSVNFWADGMRRLRKNKIAMVSLIFILIIIRIKNIKYNNINKTKII